MSRPRPGLWVAAAATAVSGFVVADQPLGGLGRIVLVAFAIGMPALAISGLLPRATAASVVLVSLSGSVVVNAVVAQVMLSVHRWSPHTGVVVIGFISAGLWLLQSTVPASSVSGGGK